MRQRLWGEGSVQCLREDDNELLFLVCGQYHGSLPLAVVVLFLYGIDVPTLASLKNGCC